MLSQCFFTPHRASVTSCGVYICTLRPVKSARFANKQSGRARGYRLWKRVWRKSAVGERASEPLRAQCSVLGRTCNSKAKRCARCSVLAGEHPLSLCCYGYNLVPYNYPPSRAASSVGLYFALRADLRAIRLWNSHITPLFIIQYKHVQIFSCGCAPSLYWLWACQLQCSLAEPGAIC